MIVLASPAEGAHRIRKIVALRSRLAGSLGSLSIRRVCVSANNSYAAPKRLSFDPKSSCIENFY